VHIVAVIAEKGGAGKTTLALALVVTVPRRAGKPL
jgi:cellulose biosynthesis protein BcsQ